MSSVNPVVPLPAMLAAHRAAIGTGFVESLTMSAGQFRINPGLLLAVDGPELGAFVGSVGAALAETQPATMLTQGIFGAYQDGDVRLSRHLGVTVLAQGGLGARANQGQAHLFGTASGTLLADESLREEVFGASSLLVRCADLTAVRAVLESLEWQ